MPKRITFLNDREDAKDLSKGHPVKSPVPNKVRLVFIKSLRCIISCPVLILFCFLLVLFEDSSVEFDDGSEKDGQTCANKGQYVGQAAKYGTGCAWIDIGLG